MELNAGDLVHQVTVQTLTQGTASSGFPTETAATLCAAFMSRSPVRGSERFTSGQLSAPITTTWIMRYRADMDPDLVDVAKARRLSYQGRLYDIVSAEVLDRKAGISLTTLARIG